MSKFIVCCEHNRCPGRPERFLGRFRTRPWICPQCGRFWTTKSYTAFGGTIWNWHEASRGGAS